MANKAELEVQMDRVRVKRTLIVAAGIGLVGASTAVVANAATTTQTDSLGICSNGQFSTYAEIFTAEAQTAAAGNAMAGNAMAGNANANGIDINRPAAANGNANAANPNGQGNVIDVVGTATANGNANAAADPGVLNKGGGVRETAVVAPGGCQQFTLSGVGNGTIAEVRGFMQGVNGNMPFAIARVNFDSAPGGMVNVETSGTPTAPMVAQIANIVNGNVAPTTMPVNGNVAPTTMPVNGNVAPTTMPVNGNVANPKVMVPAPAAHATSAGS